MQRTWNRRFAAAYVRALGLTGDDAAAVEAEAVRRLDAEDEYLNDAALVTRARPSRSTETSRRQG